MQSGRSLLDRIADGLLLLSVVCILAAFAYLVWLVWALLHYAHG